MAPCCEKSESASRVARGISPNMDREETVHEAIPVAFPKATALSIHAVTSTASREAICQRVIAKVDSEVGSRGTGGKILPSES